MWSEPPISALSSSALPISRTPHSFCSQITQRSPRQISSRIVGTTHLIACTRSFDPFLTKNKPNSCGGRLCACEPIRKDVSGAALALAALVGPYLATHENTLSRTCPAAQDGLLSHACRGRTNACHTALWLCYFIYSPHFSQDQSCHLLHEEHASWARSIHAEL